MRKKKKIYIETCLLNLGMYHFVSSVLSMDDDKNLDFTSAIYLKIVIVMKCCVRNLPRVLLRSVGIALGYGLDDRGSRVRFPEGAGNFSFHHRVQKGSGAHTASYPMGTRGSFPESKAAGA
jgi:hypothetical protein